MWNVVMTDLFLAWLIEQDESSQDKIAASILSLKQFGPELGRPDVDTLYGSKKISNLKELRTKHKGRQYRSFFAFDPTSQAIVLCAGDKRGLNEDKFYKDMIRIAEQEYEKHLESL